jgi:hypothetical protein
MSVITLGGGGAGTTAGLIGRGRDSLAVLVPCLADDAADTGYVFTAQKPIIATRA